MNGLPVKKKAKRGPNQVQVNLLIDERLLRDFDKALPRGTNRSAVVRALMQGYLAAKGWGRTDVPS